MFAKKRGVFRNAHAIFPVHERIVDDQSLARARAKRVHQLDDRVGIFLQRHLSGHVGRSECSGERRRKDHAQHGLALGRMRLESLQKFSGRNLRGGAGFPRAKAVVIGPGCLSAAKSLRAGYAANGIRHGQNFKLLKPGNNFRVKVRTGIRQNGVH